MTNSNNRLINNTWKASLPIAILAAISGSPAYAQGGANTLEEIVVTARRSEESLQSIPVTVTAFSEVDIRRKGIFNIEDIQLSTPGVYLSGSGARSNPVFMIRGQSKSLSGNMAPAVVTYFGEVPEPNWGSYVPQYDLESIQVLKGPQGTLFGKNTTGGAILFTPAAPTFEPGGFVTLGLGNENQQKVEAAVNVPIIEDTLAARFAIHSTRRDGYSYDLGNNEELDQEDVKAVRASILWTPTEKISNTFIFDMMESNTNQDAIVPLEFIPGGTLPRTFGFENSLKALIEAQDARGPRKVINVTDTSDRTEKTLINNRTEIELTDSLSVVNIFGYRDVEVEFYNNSDGLPRIPLDSGVGQVSFIKSSGRHYLEQYSNETQLLGESFNDKLTWRVGAFWSEYKPTGPDGTGVSFIAPRPTSYTFFTDESKAIFANGSYDLGDFVEGVSLDLGLRYTEDKLTACTGIGAGPGAGGLDVEPEDCDNANTSVISAATTNVGESEELTWSTGLNWQINEDLFTYILANHGYRAGTINGPTFSGRLASYQSTEPETVTNFEVGLRADWQVGFADVRTNVSAFKAMYKDVQAPISGVSTIMSNCLAFQAANPGVEVPPSHPVTGVILSPDGSCTPADDPSGNTLMTNQGETEVSGMDLELVVAPIENLTLSVGASYLDTETKKIVSNPDLAPWLAAVKGIRFEMVARKTATVAVNYELPIGSPMLESINFHADNYWTDDISFAGSWMIPGYSVTNARMDLVGLGSPNLELSFWLRNAFDKEYAAAGSIAGSLYGFNAAIMGPPRMYGAELRYSF